MILIDRKKLVNKFNISFCVERLVLEIYPLKVGNLANFWEKVAPTISPQEAWIRGTHFPEQQGFCIEWDIGCEIFVWKMPKRCVVYGCSNTADKDNNIFMNEIPFWEDNSPVPAKRRKKWLNFVRRKRDKWTPTRSSIISRVLKALHWRLFWVCYNHCWEVQDSKT